MKTFVATGLVALSLLSGVAAVISANAADFGHKQWWNQQIGGYSADTVPKHDRPAALLRADCFFQNSSL